MNSTQDEQERLAKLRGYGVLDSPNEVQFDTIVRDAAKALGTPIALISLIDENRQWFKAKVGLEPRETPRLISFCTHAIRGNDIMIVHDATLDDRCSGNPLVTGDIGIRFYAGAPLKTEDGKRIGTLCVIDTKAHPSGMTERDRATLESLARRTIQALKLRRAAQTASWSFSGALGGGPMRERSVQCSAFTASGALKAERPLAPRKRRYSNQPYPVTIAAMAPTDSAIRSSPFTVRIHTPAATPSHMAPSQNRSGLLIMRRWWPVRLGAELHPEVSRSRLAWDADCPKTW